MKFSLGPTWLVTVAGLALAGTALHGLEAPLWSRVRARQPALRLDSHWAAAGQGLLLGVLGGFRTAAADLAWLRMAHAWEEQDGVATDAWLRCASILDPAVLGFWINGARILAYDVPEWRLAAAFACGLGLIAWGGPWLLLVGLASILCGVAYTGGPWPLAYHGLGDLFVFLFFGLVAVGATYFVQAGTLGADVWLAAVPVGLLAANILIVNNYRDMETDAAAGKRTLVVRWGRGWARAQFNGSLLVALVAVPLVLAWRDQCGWRLLPLALAPLAWNHARRLRDRTAPTEQIQLLGDTGRLLALYALGLTAGLVLRCA